MVFGFDFFSRKPPSPSQDTPLPTATASPRVSFASPPQSTSPTPPPNTDDPPQDLTPLLSLLSTIPAPTLKDYILTSLTTPPPPPHSQITALTSFFSALTPPPELHCVRCHKSYYDVENSDRSCLIPHDDESALVERVQGGYETLWGCCEKTVKGDGDMGPPDGWCYEGKHTTDTKRARFRADSTPADDKLVSCAKKRCFASPVASTTRSRRKRTLSTISLEKGKEREKEKDEEEMSVCTNSSRGKRRKMSVSASLSTAKRKNKTKSKEFIASDEEEDVKMDVDAPTQTPPSPPPSTTRKPPSSSTTSSKSSRKSPARSLGRKATPRSPLASLIDSTKSNPPPSPPVPTSTTTTPIPTSTPDSKSPPKRSASVTRSGTIPVVEIVRPGSPLAKQSVVGETVYATPSPLKTQQSSSSIKPKSTSSTSKAKSMKPKSKASSTSTDPAEGKAEGERLTRRKSTASIKPSSLRSNTVDEDVFGGTKAKSQPQPQAKDAVTKGRVKKLVDVIDSSVDAERKSVELYLDWGTYPPALQHMVRSAYLDPI